MMLDIRYRYETSASPMVVSGCIGPRGDGYAPGALMRPDEARDYHRPQLLTFRDAGADLVSAFTMTNIGEAQGIALAAKAANMPCVISFTVETDGRLPAGETLAEAIKCVDDATDKGPAYYMINCAHPTHFDHVLNAGETWIKRLRGLRANSSRMSHAELDNAPELDIGDPLESAGNMLTSAAVSLTSTCLAAAAERTTAMWTVSARLAAERRKRRDEFRLARSRCGRSQVRVVMRRRRQRRERARECSTHQR